MWIGSIDTHATLRVILLGIGTALVASAIVAFLAIEQDRVEPPDKLLAAAVRKLGLESGFKNRNYLGDQFWLDLLTSAREHYRVLGVASHGYLSSAEQEEASKNAFVAAISGHGVEVELLFLKPDSDYAKKREQQEQRSTRADIADAICWFWSLKQSLEDKRQRLLELYEYDETPTSGITWSDNRMIVTLYLARRLNLAAPGIVLKGPDGELWTRYRSNFTEVKRKATVLSQERIDDLKVKAGNWRASGFRSESELRTSRNGDVDDAT